MVYVRPSEQKEAIHYYTLQLVYYLKLYTVHKNISHF